MRWGRVNFGWVRWGQVDEPQGRGSLMCMERRKRKSSKLVRPGKQRWGEVWMRWDEDKLMNHRKRFFDEYGEEKEESSKLVRPGKPRWGEVGWSLDEVRWGQVDEPQEEVLWWVWRGERGQSKLVRPGKPRWGEVKFGWGEMRTSWWTTGRSSLMSMERRKRSHPS